jgi:hypothetical protein
VTFIIGALSISGMAERLTRVAAREHIDRLHAGEIQRRDIAVVRNVGEVVGQDGRGRFVILHMPRHLAAQDCLNT